MDEDVKKEDCTLVLFHHAPGIQNGCAKCRSVISEGDWAVGLKVGSHKYVVGQDPKPECCGEKKAFMAVFTSQEAAAQHRDEVAERLRIDGTTSKIYLLEPHLMVSQSIH